MTEQWRNPERRTRVEARARFEEIKADIATRLQRVSASMAPADVESLVCRMARLHLRYEADSATRNA
jgi:hypothetical protein